jgi:hypothetical protein
MRGNWHLFPLVVNRVLKSLGHPASDQAFSETWEDLLSDYAGEGWFRDTRQAHFDYYNAWSFHYALYWLEQIDPGVDKAFIADARRAFVGFFRHFFTPKGLPIFGRSLIYRTAAPVPLVVAARTDPDIVHPGEAQRAFDRVWRYFVNRGALTGGSLSQGYCGPDIRILDRYSGPASALWGLRSLVVALSYPASDVFWTATERPLPVECRDFEVRSDVAGLKVVGVRDANSVTVHRIGAGERQPRPRPYGWKHRVAESLFGRPFRPENRAWKYKGAAYRSDEPFCGCSGPDNG